MTASRRRWLWIAAAMAVALGLWWRRTGPDKRALAAQGNATPAAHSPPPSRAAAPGEAGAPPSQAPQPSAPGLTLPSQLPPLGAQIAPPLAPTPPPPSRVPLASAVPVGQVSESDARVAGELVWPEISGCLAGLSGALTVRMGLAGGDPPGESRLYDPVVGPAGLPETVRSCVVGKLQSLRVPVASDTNGPVELTYQLAP